MIVGRPDRRQDTGGPVPMEGTGPCFKFQSGYRCGGSVIRGGDDSAISAIHSITEPLERPHGELDSLPTHLHDLVSQTSQDLDTTQQHRLADVLLRYAEDTRLTPVILYPYVAHLAECPPRR